MAAAGWVSAHGFVRHGALPALNAVVDAELADGTERFVVERRNAQRRAQFFIELPQVFEMGRQGRQFLPIIREQEFLVARVPQPRELALQHDAGRNCHLVQIVGPFTELGSTTVFFDPHDAARATHGKTQRRETLDCFW